MESRNRLFLASSVFDQLVSMRRKDRELLRSLLGQICEHPARFSDAQEKDNVGRTIDVHIAGTHAIIYWHDPADGHVRILSLRELR